MVSPTISSLALLKANYDTHQRGYLENFVPMVSECIRRAPQDVVSIPELQQQLRDQFGLWLPQSAVRSILGRVRKKGYVGLKNGAYFRNAKALEDLGFRGNQQKVMEQQEALVERFVTFCSRRFGVDLSPEGADAALQDYLEENQLLVMNAVTHGTVVPRSGRSINNSRFLVASFIRDLQETQSATLSHVETVVKGLMLANAIFLPDPGNADRNFRNTEVYLDTPFLINALGYGGESQKEPCLELLRLLYETGAELRCFAHTRDEVRGVLQSCMNIMKAGGTRNSNGPDILRTFQYEGLSETDVMMLSNNLEKDLKELKITVVEKPEYDARHQIDEDAFREEIGKNINYRRSQQVSRDVDSISAIMQLRRSRRFPRLEECRALFVTTNSTLARVTRRHFSEGPKESAVSPCLTDHTLTNLLWLKKPTAAPDLPRKRIIADCYAATRPTEPLWRLYFGQIDKLNQRGEVSPEDYYLLRYSMEAESALMDATLGDEKAFTQGTVPEVLRVVRANIEKHKQAEVDTERASKKAAEKEVEAGRKRDSRRRELIRSRAERYARWTVRTVEGLLLAFIVVASAFTFPWDLPTVTAAWGQYLLALGFLMVFVLSVAGMMYGTTVRDIANRIEVWLAHRIEKTLLTLGEEK